MIRNNVKVSAIDGSKVYYYAFELNRTYDWLVFPGSLDPEHDALVFNSRTEMLAWCRDVLEEALNAATPEGFLWHWYEGEFFLSRYCGGGAERCDDQECACHIVCA